MENKKLLNFLLKDLSELEELFDEKSNGNFDKLEMQFLQTRLKSSKKLVSILIERETKSNVITNNEIVSAQAVNVVVQKEISEEKTEVIAEEKTEIIAEEKAVFVEQQEEIVVEENIEKMEEQTLVTETEIKRQITYSEDDIELEDEENDNPNKILGDSFLKEKSVNDILASGNGKLEHKLSNRPVDSIQAAIGINDRFQYIRELFDGKSDVFSKTVTEIDGMNDLKEAVHYLQQNFKWKKNETSLKFVNLVKRRFLNE